MAKSIWIVVPGSGDDDENPVGREAQVEDNTTARDLLEAAELDPSEWQLQIERDGKFISMSDDDRVHKQVKNDEKVYVVSADMVVGPPNTPTTHTPLTTQP